MPTNDANGGARFLTLKSKSNHLHQNSPAPSTRSCIVVEPESYEMAKPFQEHRHNSCHRPDLDTQLTMTMLYLTWRCCRCRLVNLLEEVSGPTCNQDNFVVRLRKGASEIQQARYRCSG